ncbi:putative nuclease HARBI1 [Nerophis ophidion]|uniref:putative nuclease HARBI1 n=1 Tax=Nerophis ophidion TaxID=159077 RepID=UPI002AE074C2|nr:putative nuclease HARBI1 [Nerophis ophidion]
MSDALPVWFAVQAELLGHEEEVDSQSKSCFACYDDDTLFEMFHLTRACIEFVADIVRVRMKQYMLTPSSVDIMIMITLNFFALGASAVSLLRRFDLKTDCRQIVWTVSEVVAGMSDQFISFPQTRKAKVDIAHMAEEFCGIPDVLGVLAPTHFHIRTSTHDKNWSELVRQQYVNALGYKSVVSQMICDLDGNILSVEKCCVGSTSDQDLWCTSFRGREIEDELYGQYWVIGGEGYHLSKRVLTPVSDPKSDAQIRFNEAHAKLHCVTRTTLRSLKWRFRCLTKLGFTLDKLTNVVKACCVLHNIAKKFSVPLPPGEEKFEDPQPRNPCQGSAAVINPDGLRARQELIESSFSTVPGQGEPE